MQDEPKPDSDVFLADSEDMKPPQLTSETGEKPHRKLRRAIAIIIVLIVICALLIWTGLPFWLSGNNY
jgi:hypothetical protein